MKTIAIDIGNSSAKFGLFEYPELFRPVAVWLDDPTRLSEYVDLQDRIIKKKDGQELQSYQYHWVVSSVNETRKETVLAQIAQYRPDDTIILLNHSDIPFESNVQHREQLGIDRLLAAYAAWNWIQTFLPLFSQHPILIGDIGTAITVDLVSCNGQFEGGAIHPGWKLSARSLQAGTAQLPEIGLQSIGTLQYPGRDTDSAIGVALLWGTVGLIRQIAEQVERKTEKPIVVLTGKGAETVFPFLKPYFSPEQLHYLPHTVLSGIALAYGKKD